MKKTLSLLTLLLILLSSAFCNEVELPLKEGGNSENEMSVADDASKLEESNNKEKPITNPDNPQKEDEEVADKLTKDKTTEKIEENSLSTEEPANSLKEIYKETISIDIETSDYYELITWCKRLELDTDGSLDSLKQRLYKYYNTTKTNTSQKKGNKIEIESADNLNYFTIEQVDENYAELSGDVIIKLTNKDEKEKHIIKADKIMFNLKENTITATGNITYLINGESRSQNFTGQKIVFNIDNYEGLFNKGITEQNKEMEEGEDTKFFLKGNEINKAEDNVTVFKDGSITSCEKEEPHFKIKAQKIWFLTSTEWSLTQGFFYIGRVPILYFPAFIYETNKMVLNPVFGIRDDFGFFIQTSTYFIGEPKKNEESSIFDFMSNDDEDKYYKLKGLFLLEDETPSESTKAFQDYGSDQVYIKLLLDYYTNYGFYSALDLNLSKPSKIKDTGSWFTDFFFDAISIFKKTDLYVSMAKTRKFIKSGDDVLTLFANDEGIYESAWQDSYFLALKLPFRYGFDFNATMDYTWINFQVGMEAYSDSDYKTDFNNRSENLDLFSFLDNLDSSSDVSSSTTNLTSQISSYNWTASINLSPKIDILSPFIKTINIKTNTNLSWRSRTIDNSSGEYDNLVNVFFYPEQNIFPSIPNVTISGQILPITFKQNNSETAVDEDAQNEDEQIQYELVSPWDEEENTKDDENDKIENNENEIVGSAKADKTITITNYWSLNKFFTNSLTYSLSPTYSNTTQFDHEKWTIPEEINFDDVKYSFKTATIDAKLVYSANIYKNLFTFADTINFDYNYKEHYNMNELSENSISTYELEDNKGTDFIISNNIKATTNPFTSTNYFKSLQLKYEFDTIFYSYDFSVEDDDFIEKNYEFDEEFITKHLLTFTMPISLTNQKHSLTISSSLPPINLEVKGAYNLKYFFTDTDISTKITKIDEEDIVNSDSGEENEEFEFDPLTIKEKLTFAENNYLLNTFIYDYKLSEIETNTLIGKFTLFDSLFAFDGNFKYDFQEDKIDNLSLKLNFWKFSTSLSAKTTYDYSYSYDSGWVQAEEESFIPTAAKFGFDLDIADLKIWKNRIDFDMNLDGGIDFDLIKYNKSSFNISFNFGIEIYKFLKFNIKVESENSVIYRYFPGLCSEFGIEPLNMFEDIFKSFNFFNENDRYQSNFNLNTINLSLSHDLHDWDLVIDYKGKPKLDETEKTPKYIWDSTLSISLKWKTIPEFKSEIEITKDKVTY